MLVKELAACGHLERTTARRTSVRAEHLDALKHRLVELTARVRQHVLTDELIAEPDTDAAQELAGDYLETGATRAHRIAASANITASAIVQIEVDEVGRWRP